MPVKVETWQCTKCQSIYNTLAEAEVCETKPIRGEKMGEVGDYVTCGSGWGWWNSEDKSWRVINPANKKSESHFDWIETYTPIWRVVHKGMVKEYGRHKVFYVLYSPHSMLGSPLFRVTSPDHFDMAKIAAPPNAKSCPTPEFEIPNGKYWSHKYQLV